MDFDYVIVGGSTAGMSAVETIESAVPEATVAVIDRGHDLPHDRPALSKQLLTREVADDAALLRSAVEWQSGSTRLLSGIAVAGVGEDRSVQLSSGETVQAGAVVLAPGCRPRTLPLFHGAPNAVTLRTMDDLRLLRALTARSAKVLLVGGGFIGLEVASSLIGAGHEVTIVELDPLPLQGTIGPGPARWLIERAQRSAVRILTSRSVVDATVDQAGRVTDVTLSDGVVLSVDVVVVGIGVVPDIDWLEGGPVTLAGGIEADEMLQTSVPGVFAAGDAVEFPDQRTKRRTRVEHWTTAREQGRTAALNAIAWSEARVLEPFAGIPYVWSDQFGIRIQLAGSTRNATRHVVRIERGEQLWVEYFENDDLCAVLGVNMRKEVMQARRLLASRPLTSHVSSSHGRDLT